MKAAAAIFRFLLDRRSAGERVALVTITEVTGSSSRSPGAHMAVSETGLFAGSFSGGCVEAAVVAEARRVIATGCAEIIRFGAGSRYIDIRLPCGGGLDLLIVPDPSEQIIRSAAELLAGRQPITLLLGLDGGLSLRPADPGSQTGWSDDLFHVCHDPDLRLIVAGHGAEPRSMARLGSSYGAEIVVLSPDAELVSAMRTEGQAAYVLKTPARSTYLNGDPWTAIVLLFHDHDWEAELLAQALDSPAFFVGAMGSRRTHASRLDALARLGVAPANRNRLVAPLGLIPATRDPDTLALSALAQIVAAHEVRARGTRAQQDDEDNARPATSGEREPPKPALVP